MSTGLHIRFNGLPHRLVWGQEHQGRRERERPVTAQQIVLDCRLAFDASWSCMEMAPGVEAPSSMWPGQFQSVVARHIRTTDCERGLKKGEAARPVARTSSEEGIGPVGYRIQHSASHSAISSFGSTFEYSGESTPKSPMGMSRPLYPRDIEQPEEERHRLLSVEVALSSTVFQVHVCDGVIVEIIRVEFKLCKDTYTVSSWLHVGLHCTDSYSSSR